LKRKSWPVPGNKEKIRNPGARTEGPQNVRENRGCPPRDGEDGRKISQEAKTSCRRDGVPQFVYELQGQLQGVPDDKKKGVNRKR